MFRNYIFTFLLALPSLSFGYVRIGNGGEGVLENGRIYVRDLYEQGSHLNPWFGADTAPHVWAAWYGSRLFTQFSAERDYVVRKITDIERIFPGLGFAAIRALDKYNYIFVEKLDLLNNDSDTVPDSRRVQIAVRRYGDLYLSKEAWAKMDVEARAALLIHEAVYGLGKIHCGPQVCEQISREVRPLIGQLFFSSPRLNLKSEIARVLNVNSLAGVCEKPAARFEYAVISNTDKGRVYDSFVSDYQFVSDQWRGDVRNICERAEKVTDQSLAVVFSGVLFQQTLETKIYKVDVLGSIETQQGFYTKALFTPIKLFVNFQDKESCEMNLSHLVTQALNAKSKRGADVLETSLICLGALAR